MAHQILATINEENFLKTASAKDINVALRGIYICRMIEMQKTETSVSEQGLIIIEVNWAKRRTPTKHSSEYF